MLTKFHDQRTKILDLLQWSYFWAWVKFFVTVFRYQFFRRNEVSLKQNFVKLQALKIWFQFQELTTPPLDLDHHSTAPEDPVWFSSKRVFFVTNNFCVAFVWRLTNHFVKYSFMRIQVIKSNYLSSTWIYKIFFWAVEIYDYT